MIRTIVIAGCILAMTACSTTSEVHQAPRLQAGQAYSYSFSNQGGDNEEGIARLDGIIQSRLREAGLLVPGSENPQVKVVLKHYYVRSNATRVMAGIFAGRDKIVSNVTVVGSDGALLGNFDVETFNASAWGTADGLMEKHAEEIVAKLKAA